MKLTTTMTFEGLVRALRWKAHDLAEAAEADHASRVGERDDDRPVRQAPRPRKAKVHDRTGR